MSETIDAAASTQRLEYIRHNGAIESGALVSAQREYADDVRRWNEIIDRQLIEWGLHPEELEDEELRAPTPEAISRAGEEARSMRDAGQTAPTRTIPNGDGGIVFELRIGSVFNAIEISHDGSIEQKQFVDAHLVFRMRR